MEVSGWAAIVAASLSVLYVIFKRAPALLHEARKTVRAYYALRAEVERGRRRAITQKSSGDLQRD